MRNLCSLACHMLIIFFEQKMICVLMMITMYVCVCFKMIVWGAKSIENKENICQTIQGSYMNKTSHMYQSNLKIVYYTYKWNKISNQQACCLPMISVMSFKARFGNKLSAWKLPKKSEQFAFSICFLLCSKKLLKWYSKKRNMRGLRGAHSNMNNHYVLRYWRGKYISLCADLISHSLEGKN